eukprot:scaffold1200_cov383-Prasinococcus_capsulatus_cf.AAC.9
MTVANGFAVIPGSTPVHCRRSRARESSRRCARPSLRLAVRLSVKQRVDSLSPSPVVSKQRAKHEEVGHGAPEANLSLACVSLATYLTQAQTALALDEVAQLATLTPDEGLYATLATVRNLSAVVTIILVLLQNPQDTSTSGTLTKSGFFQSTKQSAGVPGVPPLVLHWNVESVPQHAL